MSRRKVSNYDFLSRYNYFVPGWPEIIIILALLLAGAVIGSLVNVLFTLVAGQDSLDAATLVSYPFMFIPAMIYASSRSRRNRMTRGGVALDSNNFGRYGFWLCAVLAMLMTIALGICSDPVNALLPPMPEWLESALGSMTRGTLWINFVCVSIFAPVFEEWLCRGMVLRGLLAGGTKPFWAIVLSALFFALIHLNPWQAVPAFILGCAFGYVYYRTGSLRLTMLMHFANNTLALVLSNIDSLRDAEGWMEIMPGNLFWICAAAALLLTVLAARVFRRIPLASEKGSCDSLPSMFDE